MKVNLKIILFTALLVIILGAIAYLAYMNHNGFVRAMIHQTQQDLLNIAKSEAQSIARYIGDIHKELDILSSGNIVQQDILENYDKNLKDQYFEPLEDYYKGLTALADRVYLMDANGKVLYRSPFSAEFIGKDLSDREDIKEALARHKASTSRISKSVHGEDIISNLHPIFENEKFIGLLRAVILLPRVDELTQHLNQGEETYSFVIDDRGDLLSYPDKSYVGKGILTTVNEKFPGFSFPELKDIIGKMIQGKEGTAMIKYLSRGTGAKIADTLVAFTPVDVGNNTWSICVAMDYGVISAAIKANAVNNIIFAGFALLVLLLPVILYFKAERQRYLYEISSTASNIINKQLHLEIEDRRRIEEELKKSIFKPRKQSGPDPDK